MNKQHKKNKPKLIFKQIKFKLNHINLTTKSN